MNQGLSSQQALKKLSEIGTNEIIVKKNINAFSIFLSQFPTFINFILLVGGLFSLFIGNIIDSTFIFAIIVLSSSFGFFQEYNAEKSLEKLKNYIQSKSRVFRNGKEVEILSAEIVPGDIVIINEGESIPADGIIITSHYLEINESVLTGESIPITKADKDSAFLGTVVTKGKCHMLVEKTGMNTKFGQIANSLSAIKTDKTPLQKNLAELGKVISIFAIFIAFLLIPIGLSQNRNLFHLILLSTSAAVSAIPEGLPAVITIALAIGTSRMAKKNAIVRKMSSVETLGTVQIILSDKTGTITKNEMSVKEFWPYKKDKLKYMLMAGVIGNTASLIQKNEPNNYDIVGDKTDGAVLLWVKKQVDNLKTLTDDGKVIDEFVFNPETKIITSVFEENQKRFVFVRGAPEKLLELSSLSSGEKLRIETEFENYAKKGLRIIAFGYKEQTDTVKDRKNLEKDLEFLGFVGIYDPPREEAIAAIKNAKQAGIKIIMVTGDNEITALAIAKEVNLIEKDGDVISGNELDNLSDEELKKLILKTSIFARTKPEDKLRLVTLLKEMGYVVGVTGDGVNDALALKKADVGISMGLSGTDVAKEASDIILADDNFSSLIKAVLEGRTIYNNIIKSITYLLSSNLSEISLILIAALLKMPDPLIPTQILWINLVTDGLPALALASDNRNIDVLKDKPRNSKQSILNIKRLALIFTIGISLAVVLILIFGGLLHTQSELRSKTIIFNLLIFSHLVLAFLVRGKLMFKFNKLLVISFIFAILLQAIITTISPFKEIFKLGL
jgi:P-type Ca2+ transporter type 2C